MPMKSMPGKKPGLPPGSLVYSGKHESGQGKVRITVFDYDAGDYREKECAGIDEALDFLENKKTVKWLNISGLHDAGVVERIGSRLGVHPLTLEDILNTSQRPKVEDYPGYIYIVFKMITRDDEQENLLFEQLSILLGSDYVVTFQEIQGDFFDPLRERIRTGNGRVRKMGADYLAYLLIDNVVDNYFMILESLSEKIEEIEQILLSAPGSSTLHRIHTLKWDMLSIRKAIWPLREAVNNLVRSESGLVRPETGHYLRDLYDHTLRAVDIIETLRDFASGMLEIYLSSISNRMNEVMKVLTIIATIFIPLTLVAGIYGMNFEFMPELQYRWAYPAVLGIMAAIGVGMLVYFRRRKWL